MVKKYRVILIVIGAIIGTTLLLIVLHSVSYFSIYNKTPENQNQSYLQLKDNVPQSLDQARQMEEKLSEKPREGGCPDMTPLPKPQKPSHTIISPKNTSMNVVVIFSEGSGIRLRMGKFVSINGTDFTLLTKIVSKYKLRIQRLYTESEDKIEASHIALQKTTCQVLPDLNLDYLITLEQREDISKLIDSLNSLSIVELAYPESKIVNPSLF